MVPQTPLAFLAGTPGPLELLFIFAVVLVLFGPRKLPEIARSLGRILFQLRHASEEFKEQVMSIEHDPSDEDENISPDTKPDNTLPAEDSPLSTPYGPNENKHQGTSHNDDQ